MAYTFYDCVPSLSSQNHVDYDYVDYMTPAESIDYISKLYQRCKLKRTYLP